GEVSLRKSENEKATDDLKVSKIGGVADLLIPILTLFIATIGFIVWTGYQALEKGEMTLIAIFGEADVSLSLFAGGIVALLVAIGFFMKHIIGKHLTGLDLFKGMSNGIKTMFTAVVILIFAWTITDLIDQLGTGHYLASLVKDSAIPFGLLP